MRHFGGVFSVIALASTAFFLLTGCVTEKPSMALIPLPATVLKADQVTMSFDPARGFLADKGLENEIQWLVSWFAKAGISCPAGTPNPCLRLHLDPSESSQEGYRLDIRPDQTTITAKTSTGIFYGLQTLRQLLPFQIENGIRPSFPWPLPVGSIEDRPRFEWRGFMLDSARHLQSVEYIHKTLDRMASLKMNRFHWHLTDDQGWRIPIDSRPKLIEIGSWRDSKDEGHYGGSYTKEQIREIVDYAHRLHILVVPEIDMPGHVTAAVAAYPELGCRGDHVRVQTEWGVFDQFLNPGKEAVYSFVADVLKEVFELFPDPYFHIGGDEVSDPSVWARDPVCRAKMRELGISNPARLQNYFTSRVEKLVNAAGKNLIGWDDIQDGRLQRSTVLQFWTHEGLSRRAISDGRRIIVTPSSHAYLDMFYEAPQRLLWAGYIPTQKTHSLDPSYFGFKDENVLGIEAALWTELTPTSSDLDFKIFPRLPALAEAAWSPQELRNWENWKARATMSASRWKAMGIDYYRDPSMGLAEN